MPMVMIDQDADPEATIVQLSFGNRLGALIDTVRGSISCFGFMFYLIDVEKSLALLDLLELDL